MGLVCTTQLSYEVRIHGQLLYDMENKHTNLDCRCSHLKACSPKTEALRVPQGTARQIPVKKYLPVRASSGLRRTVTSYLAQCEAVLPFCSRKRLAHRKSTWLAKSPTALRRRLFSFLPTST